MFTIPPRQRLSSPTWLAIRRWRVARARIRIRNRIIARVLKPPHPCNTKERKEGDTQNKLFAERMKPYTFSKVVFWTLCKLLNRPSRKPYLVIYTRADVAEWLRRSAAIRSTRNQLSTLLFQSQHWDIQHTSIVNTNDTWLLLNTQRVREFEPRRLRLSFFLFVVVSSSLSCCFASSSSVACGANLFSWWW